MIVKTTSMDEIRAVKSCKEGYEQKMATVVIPREMHKELLERRDKTGVSITRQLQFALQKYLKAMQHG